MLAPVEHLDGLKRLDIRFSLDPISRFLERLNNPQNAYGTVLVGGTNGKGSIAAMVASALSHGSFRVGRLQNIFQAGIYFFLQIGIDIQNQIASRFGIDHVQFPFDISHRIDLDLRRTALSAQIVFI